VSRRKTEKGSTRERKRKSTMTPPNQLMLRCFFQRRKGEALESRSSITNEEGRIVPWGAAQQEGLSEGRFVRRP